VYSKVADGAIDNVIWNLHRSETILLSLDIQVLPSHEPHRVLMLIEYHLTMTVTARSYTIKQKTTNDHRYRHVPSQTTTNEQTRDVSIRTTHTATAATRPASLHSNLRFHLVLNEPSPAFMHLKSAFGTRSRGRQCLHQSGYRFGARGVDSRSRTETEEFVSDEREGKGTARHDVQTGRSSGLRRELEAGRNGE
jgi:hypothetical protein